MKYMAIPQRADGTDKLGTEGVLTGNYITHASARRYLSKYMKSGTTYTLYTVAQSQFTKVGEFSA